MSHNPEKSLSSISFMRHSTITLNWLQAVAPFDYSLVYLQEEEKYKSSFGLHFLHWNF